VKKRRFYFQLAIALAMAFVLALMWEYFPAAYLHAWLPGPSTYGAEAEGWRQVIVFTVIFAFSLVISMHLVDHFADGTAIDGGDISQTRSLLTTAVESFSDGFVYFDADDKFVFCNTAYRQAHPGIDSLLTHGMDFGEIVRRLVEIGFYGNSKVGQNDMIAARLETYRAGVPFEYRMQDGRWFHMAQFKTQDGGTALVRTDITEHKLAELAIYESEELFRTVMNNLPVGVSIKDRAGRYQFTNRLYQDWYGFEADSFKGQLPDDVLSDTAQTRSARQQHQEDVLQSGQVISREDEKLRADGKDHHVFITKFPIFDRAGEIVSVGSVSTDITEIKVVETRLRTAKNTAERDSRAKTQFLASMSHDLRTPLNAIIGFAEVMKGELFGPLGAEKYNEYAHDIHQSGKNLLALVSDILDVSRIEAGEMEITSSEVDLEKTFADCFRLFQGERDKTDCALSHEVAADFPQLWADELRLKQILVNLISNSFKFTPNGGTIAVLAFVGSDGGICLSVTDTGMGIRASDLARIMEPFVQASDIMSRPHEGSGLGLHQVKSLMELHGGTVAIDSEIGQGTKVTVTFPTDRTINPADGRR